MALQSLLLDPYGMPVKASTRSYQQNSSDYRKSHIIRALSVLSLYEAVAGPETPSAFSQPELAEIQARLKLTDKTFGGLVGELNLQRYNEQQITDLRDTRGHNWEFLRQHAEAESLFFEPLQMPDGSTTHAILWVAKSDLTANQGKRYDGRFLNISNPWTDKRLLDWPGYTETRFVDSANRSVSDRDAGRAPDRDWFRSRFMDWTVPRSRPCWLIFAILSIPRSANYRDEFCRTLRATFSRFRDMATCLTSLAELFSTL